MINKINEIKHILFDIQECIKNNTLMGALFMCLALPDICGKLEHPEISKNKERYVKWFNEHCANFYNPFIDVDTGTPSIDFDADCCYKLRCYLLHAGETDIGEEIDVNNFQLLFENNKNGNFVFESSPSTQDNDSYMKIDVRFLCETMLAITLKFIVDYEKCHK